MDKIIFEFQDYKKFLEARAKAQGRGFKKAFAEAAQIQTTYVSQVLGGAAHLSLEQAQSSCSFLGLNRDESYFFLLLVQKARAGTESLIRLLEEQIKKEQDRHLTIRERVGMKSPLSSEAKARYYSSWHFAAIHMLVTIPRYRKPGDIARRLSVPLPRVLEILGFLTVEGLVKAESGQYLPGDSQIYLEKSSPLIAKHHINWRMRSIDSLDRAEGSDVHFSSVLTLNAEAAHRIRQILVQAIEESLSVVKQAPEEQMMVMCLDFFDH